MPQNWDNETRRVIIDDVKTSVPYLLSTEQVSRWSAAGFDIVAAARRVAAFHVIYRATQTAKEATLALRDFYRAEAEIAIAQGVSENDTNLSRIRSAPSNYMWSLAA